MLSLQCDPLHHGVLNTTTFYFHWLYSCVHVFNGKSLLGNIKIQKLLMSSPL